LRIFFVTITVCKYMGAVNWCPSFCKFPYSTSSYTLVYDQAKWKEVLVEVVVEERKMKHQSKHNIYSHS